jgi:hypothetical protein
MLREKIHRGSKIGDTSHKDDCIVNRPFVAGVAGPVILGIALLMPVGVSNAVGESLISDKPFAVSEPKTLAVSEPKSIKVSEPKILEVSEPKSIKVSEPKSLETSRFPKGKYTPAERENPAYDRCESLKEFSEQLNCANEALGITQE